MASALILHTVREAKASGLPVIPFFADKQSGDTFGERLANAIETGFAAGYQRLIVCGTDSPSLTSDQFVKTAQKLTTHDLVLGPSNDGGIYLFGLQKAIFSKKALLQIPWLTSFVFSSLKNLAAHSGLSYAVEQKGADIDHISGVLQWQHQKRKHWLALFIAGLSSRAKRIKHAKPQTLFHTAFEPTSFSLRGPPSLWVLPA